MVSYAFRDDAQAEDEQRGEWVRSRVDYTFPDVNCERDWLRYNPEGCAATADPPVERMGKPEGDEAAEELESVYQVERYIDNQIGVLWLYC